ncbi:hypothetical protein XELAEV_18035553mg [Xenopus laevis]|uniref:Uncharacterized protein n=1 Tax=Xenopus laevis TaxID=8355 RepID=A0A974HC85_XENLA|nr:hypothetical protein XELAEV_18035553mg [Xenopus laevis]
MLAHICSERDCGGISGLGSFSLSSIQTPNCSVLAGRIDRVCLLGVCLGSGCHSQCDQWLHTAYRAAGNPLQKIIPCKIQAAPQELKPASLVQ